MPPDGRFGADPIAGRDALLRRTLDQAFSELERRLGPDMEHWRYGQARLKHIRIGYPLGEAVRPDLRAVGRRWAWQSSSRRDTIAYHNVVERRA